MAVGAGITRDCERSLEFVGLCDALAARRGSRAADLVQFDLHHAQAGFVDARGGAFDRSACGR